jgi:hypothetical protein
LAAGLAIGFGAAAFATGRLTTRATTGGAAGAGGAGGGGGVDGIGSIQPDPDQPISIFRNSAMRPSSDGCRGKTCRWGEAPSASLWGTPYILLIP